MPPRQPLKLKSTAKSGSKAVPKPPVTGSRLATTPQPILPAPAAKPSRLGTLLKAATQGKSTLFSPYPDLALAIGMLEKRRQQLAATPTTDDRLELIDKWLLSLNKVQTEMTRLRRLEGLTATLGRREPAT